MISLSLCRNISQLFRLSSVVAVAVSLITSLPHSAFAAPNPQMKQVLDTYSLLSPLPVEKVTPAVAKAAPSISAAVKAVMLKEGKKAPPFTGMTEDIEIPGAAGNIAARIYKPASDGPFPTILYIHGGG